MVLFHHIQPHLPEIGLPLCRGGEHPGDNQRMSSPCNIAVTLPQLAAQMPERIALRWPDAAHPVLRYRDLDARSDAIAAGLSRYGIVRGARCVVMVRPSPEFFLLMFALFKLGAVPVLVDPGIDKRALKQCLAEAEPDAFIGIPLAHLARKLLGWVPRARYLVTVGRRWGWGGITLAQIERAGVGAGPQLAATGADEIAAILFTSGSTGVPKGVVYRHRHFPAQIQMLREVFGMEAGGVDMPTFPPFALFDPALGLTSIIPDMDPTRPAKADPRKLHAAIKGFGVTQLFGSPALMKVLADHGAPLPGVTRVASAGAPVPPDVVAKMRCLLSENAQFWTPYGATECLPVSVIEGRTLEATRAATETGAGTCVGHPVQPNLVRIIAMTDTPIGEWTDVHELPVGQIGEITVTGPTTTDAYFNRDAATRAAKIRERLPGGSERIVHRMGDVGYFDDEGRLWFCGRKTQRVETCAGALYTEQVEPVFNVHPKVFRSALVGVGEPGRQIPVVCVELHPGAGALSRIEPELRILGARFAHTARIAHFLHHRKFPVDIRHNAKIRRETLAQWAARKLPG